MSDQQSLDDRQHATELQGTLERWRGLRLASQTSLHILVRFEPADDRTHEARTIVAALREHGRPTARFVAGQVGGAGAAAVLWWIESQLAESFARDNESAVKFDDIRLIVDIALLQAEAAGAGERQFMELAISQARKSVAEEGGPHPKVGAVVVKDGKVVATAHRGEMGEGDHAEFTALEKKLKDEVLAGAIVYATLEPCTRRSHSKTPCAQRLIDRKVKRVVIGMLDPNPLICGRGQRLLQSRGIEVQHFPHDLVMQLEEINREFTQAQEAAAASPPSPPPPAAFDVNAELRELQRRFVVAQDRFPREVSFALAMIPHDERPAWTEAKRRYDDPIRPPQKYGWRCLRWVCGADTAETISIPESERPDGGNVPELHPLEAWKCWLFRQSPSAEYPTGALSTFLSLADDACRLLDLRDCSEIIEGCDLKGKRGEYQHLLRWAIEQLPVEECVKWTWLDPPNEHVRTTLRPGHTPRRWAVEMPCVFAAVAHALDRHISRKGNPWPRPEPFGSGVDPEGPDTR